MCLCKFLHQSLSDMREICLKGWLPHLYQLRCPSLRSSGGTFVITVHTKTRTHSHLFILRTKYTHIVEGKEITFLNTINIERHTHTTQHTHNKHNKFHCLESTLLVSRNTEIWIPSLLLTIPGKAPATTAIFD